MSEEIDTRPLYRKFDVRRTDGGSAPSMKHDGCRYFVLDLSCDKFAPPAIAAYANACEATRPQLAADLRKWLQSIWDASEPQGGAE